MDNVNSSLKNQQKLISESGTKYAELAQHVNQLTNTNLDLKEGEYEEFLSLSNQIAEQFPGLIKGYDDNGNAVLNLNGNIENINATLDDYVKKAKEASDIELAQIFTGEKKNEDGDSDEYFKGAKIESQELFYDYDTKRKKNHAMQTLYDLLNGNLKGPISDEDNAYIPKILDDLVKSKSITDKQRTTLRQWSDHAHDDADFYKDFNDDTRQILNGKVPENDYQTETFELFLKSRDTIAENLLSYQDDEEQAFIDLQKKNAEISQSAQSVLKRSNLYLDENTSDEMRTAMSNALNMIDWSQLDNVNNGKEAAAYIREQFSQNLSKLNKEDKSVVESFFNANPEDMDLSEYVDLYNNVKNIFEKQDITIPIEYSIQDYIDVRDKLDENIRGWSRTDPDAQKKIDEHFQKNGINTFSEIEEFNKRSEGSSTVDEAIHKSQKNFENQVSKSFSDVWNDDNHSSDKNKLKQLAKSGELTPELIESTESYKSIWEDTNLTLDEFIKKIRETLTLQDSLNLFNDDTKKLGNAYADYKKNGYVSSSSLKNIPNGFKDLDGYAEFKKTVKSKKTSSSKKQSAFNDLIAEYLETNKYLDKLTTETSQKEKKNIAAALTEAGIQNGKELVDHYTAESKVISDFEGEIENLNADELANYSHMLDQKGIKSADIYSQIGSNATLLMNKLGSKYGEDLDNWLKALDEKKRTWNEFVDALDGAQGKTTDEKYHNAVTTLSGKKKGQSAYDYVSTIGGLQQRATQAMQEADAAKATVNSNYKKITSQFEINYNPTTSSDDNSIQYTSKQSDAKQEIDWLSRRLTRMQNIIDLTASKLQNLFSFKAKNNNLDKQISQSTKLMKQYGIAADKYQNKANKIAAGSKKSKPLSKDIINKVKSGKITKKSYGELVKKYGQDEADRINNYIDFYDKSQDAKKNKQEQKAKIRELSKQKYQNYVDRSDSYISLYEQRKENAATASGKNTQLDKEAKWYEQSYAYQIKIAGLEKKKTEQKRLQAELNEKLRELEIEKHQNLADEYQSSLDLYTAQKENRKTASDKNRVIDQEKEATKQLYAEKIAIAGLEGNVNEQLKLQEDLSRQLVVLEKEKFDNISHYYENLRNLNDNSYQDLNNAADELEARGLIVGSSLYSSQIALNNAKKKGYEDELRLLEQQLPNIEEGTDEWYEALDAIQACENGIAGCTKDSIQLGEAIRDVEWQLNDKISSRFDLLSSEYDLMIKLMSNKQLTDDDTGNFTAEGTATLGAYYAQLQLATEKTQSFKSTLDDMWNKLENGEEGYTDQAAWDEYYEKYDEYIKLVETEYDIQQNLINLMKEKYEAELNCLKDIIDKRKELLQAEKDAYDYQRTIEEKTKNIGTLQKQLSALSGDDSEGAKTRIQQLKISLDEAKKDLQDTEYDQWITDQQTMLDNLYNEYSDFIDDKLNETDKLLEAAIDYLQSEEAQETMKETIGSAIKNNNYDPTTDFEKVMTSLGPGGSIVSAINNVTNTITEYFKQKQADSDEAAKVIQAISEIGQVDYDGEGRQRLVAAEKAYASLSPGAKRIVDSTSINGLSTMQQKQREWLKTGQEHDRQVAEEKDSNARNELERIIKETYYQDASLHGGKTLWGTSKKGDGAYGQVQDKFYNHGLTRPDKKYVNAAGIKEITRRLGYPENSQTATALLNYMNSIGYSQGGVARRLQKIPILNGDKGWITIAPHERVLTEEQNKAFEKLVGNMDVLNPAFDHLSELSAPGLHAVPEYNTTSIGDIQINMELPNVTNYEEFRQKLQTDPKIETMFKSMIYDKNSFSKYKIRM